MSRLARAAAMALALSAAWSCGMEFDNDLPPCSKVTIQGVVPIAFDELATHGMRACLGSYCDQRDLIQPLFASTEHPGWYLVKMDAGRARPLEPGRTELYLLLGTLSPVSDQELVRLTVKDADAGVLFEQEQTVDFAHSGDCKVGTMQLGP
jgi:hypothetical protein